MNRQADMVYNNKNCLSCSQIDQGLRTTHYSWPCPECGYFNSPFRASCSRCGEWYADNYDREPCPHGHHLSVEQECIQEINRARAHFELMQHCSSFKTMRRIRENANQR